MPSSESSNSSLAQMWEILVPTVSNEGAKIRTEAHQIWDKKVKEVAGGLTILTPAKGVWIAPDASEYSERMIPVRIMCSREQILRIAKMTKDYYQQLAVLVYRISEECIVV